MEQVPVENVDQEIAETASELKPFGVNMHKLSKQNLNQYIKTNANGDAKYGILGIPQDSTNQNPALLVESEASFCTLLFATDAQGNALTMHRPAFLPNEDVLPEQIVESIKSRFNDSQQKALLVTGTHEPARVHTALRTFIDEKFPDFERIYMFSDPNLSQNEQVPHDIRYPFSSLLYVPPSLSVTNSPELLVGYVEDLKDVIKDKFHQVEFK